MPIQRGVKKSSSISKKLSDECLVTIKKGAQPPPKLLLIVRLPLKLDQSVVGVSTKSIHERILLNLMIWWESMRKMMNNSVFYTFWVNKMVEEDPIKSQTRISWGWVKPSLLCTTTEAVHLVGSPAHLQGPSALKTHAWVFQPPRHKHDCVLTTTPLFETFLIALEQRFPRFSTRSNASLVWQWTRLLEILSHAIVIA